MSEPAFGIRLANWQQDQSALKRIRWQVFVLEQGVPESLEWDGKDATSFHVIAENDAGAAIGTARLLPDGHIGRMAVLSAWRHRGVGRQLLDTLLDIAANRKFATVYLHAQTHAVTFYEKSGFKISGPEFSEAGIPHRLMSKKLDT